MKQQQNAPIEMLKKLSELHKQFDAYLFTRGNWLCETNRQFSRHNEENKKMQFEEVR